MGSGKTALVAALCRLLAPRYQTAVITNDIYTREDAEALLRLGVLPVAAVGGLDRQGPILAGDPFQGFPNPLDADRVAAVRALTIIVGRKPEH